MTDDPLVPMFAEESWLVWSVSPENTATDFGISVPLTQAGPFAYTIPEAEPWPSN